MRWFRIFCAAACMACVQHFTKFEHFSTDWWFLIVGMAFAFTALAPDDENES